MTITPFMHACRACGRRIAILALTLACAFIAVSCNPASIDPPAGLSPLEVGPRTVLASSGPHGGPFIPDSQTYTLTNDGDSPIEWIAGCTQPWITLSKTGGTLAVGRSDVITAAINSDARDLPPGTYNDTITFTNLTDGQTSTVCLADLTVDPETPPVVSTSDWQNMPFALQRGVFTVQFEATPDSVDTDGMVALSTGPAEHEDLCAVAVRFAANNTIDVRDGDTYTARVPASYTAGRTYHFLLRIDTAARLYDVYVQPEGEIDFLLASQCAFAPDAESSSGLANWAVMAASGHLTISNFWAARVPLIARAGTDVTVMHGQPVILNGTASGGTAPYIWRWEPADGLSDDTVARPVATPDDTSVYTLTITDAEGATAVAAVRVTVTDEPPSLSASAGQDVRIPPHSAATLNGSISGGRPPYEVAWSPSDGLHDAGILDPVASPQATTTYTLTVRDADGATASDSVTVIVEQSPLVASAGPDRTIAPGGSTTLGGSASGGEPPYAFSWSPATGLSSATVANPVAAPSATTGYTLTVSDAAGHNVTDSMLVVVSNSTPPDGTVYYVSPGGDDNNPGTAAAPWRTLGKAARTATAGATVLVRPGVYYENLRPARSGQPGQLITFRSEVKHGAVIDGQGSRDFGIRLDGRQYIRVEGFEIRRHATGGICLQTFYSNFVEGLEVVGNYIHHNGDYVYWSGDSGLGIQACNLRNSLIEDNEIYYNGDSAIGLNGVNYQAANVTIRGNDIHYNGRDGITGSGTNIVIEYNRMYDNIHTGMHQDCLELWMCNGIIVRYNIMGDYTQLAYGGMVSGMAEPFVDFQVYGNVFFNSRYWSEKGESCPGVFIDCRDANQWNHFRNIQIHSNTFLFLGRTPILLYGNGSLTMDDVRIYNNIFYQCGGAHGTGAYSIDSDFTNVRADYNCFTNVEPNLPGQDRHSITTNDPGFVDYAMGDATFDARLRAGSPCIDSGLPALPGAVSLPAPFVDMTGEIRPGGGNYDIGAYEY